MQTFETVSFHIIKPCNMKCKFCYATFDDMHVQVMKLYDALNIIHTLREAGVQKITFAGGEPMMYPHLSDCLIYAKSIGMTTSIITNGTLLSLQWIKAFRKTVDWIGLSIDSLNEETNRLIGRVSRKESYTYTQLISMIKEHGYKLKINTVVNTHNKDEDFNSFITWAQPDRWKVFQALRVEGQNDTQFDAIKVSDEEYNNFVIKHSWQKSLVAENNEAMTGSYLLIDPQGRLFENSAGKHTYSDSLIDHSFDHCLSQISLDRDMFIKRGGIYNW